MGAGRNIRQLHPAPAPPALPDRHRQTKRATPLAELAVVLAHLVLVESEAFVARRLEGRVGQQQPAVFNPPHQSRAKFDFFHPGLLFPIGDDVKGNALVRLLGNWLNLVSVKRPTSIGKSTYPLQIPVTKTCPFLNQEEAAGGLTGCFSLSATSTVGT